jgi:hypothetical protein
MHRSRARLLEPLEGQLSAEHYPGLVRSVALELGAAARRVAEIKEGSGREAGKVRRGGGRRRRRRRSGRPGARRPLPPPLRAAPWAPACAGAVAAPVPTVRRRRRPAASQVAAAARQACRHYSAFLGTFAPASGALPQQRLDEGNEGHYLSACFSLGRAAAKLDPSDAGWVGERALGRRALGGASGCLQELASPRPLPESSPGAAWRHVRLLPAACRDAARLQAAHRYLAHGVQYIRRHGLEERRQEAELAEQMAGLLLERARLASQAALLRR